MEHFLAMETESIRTIDEYLQDYLKTRIRWKQPSRSAPSLPILSNDNYSAWSECIALFKSKFEKLLPSRFPWERYRPILIHNPNGVVTVVEDLETTLKDYSLLDSYIYEFAQPSHEAPELHLFKNIYDVYRFVCDNELTNVYIADTPYYILPTILNAGRPVIFTRKPLITKLDISGTSNPCDTLLGDFKADYLADMLDISNPSICALLPYLLSAYVYNYKTNSLIRRGNHNKIVFEFEPNSLDSSDAPRIRKQLHTLSNRFKFPSKMPSWKESYLSSVDEPKAWDITEASRPWESQILIWHIFFAWSGIFLTSTNQFIQSTVRPQIDFEASLALFSHYVGCPAQYANPSSNIPTFLAQEYIVTFGEPDN